MPAPGQVEIRVHATGLNFRDVLNVLDMYPGDAGLLGSECVGRIAAVGDGVSEYKVGDRVLAMAAGVKRRLEVDAEDGRMFQGEADDPADFVVIHAALDGRNQDDRAVGLGQYADYTGPEPQS